MTSSLSYNELQQSEAFTAMVRLQNEKLSERHNRLMKQLSEATLEPCLRQRASEERRGIPLGYWSFEEGISDAFDGTTRARKTLASLGGRKKRVDALQGLIEKLVGKKSNLSKAQLLGELEQSIHQSVIIDVESEVDSDGKAGLIRFMDRGREKTTKISSVQHRLARAKKKHQGEKILNR